MALFYSFKDVANTWKMKYRVQKVQVEALESSTRYLQKWVQAQHGKVGPSNSIFTIARKGSAKPLVDQGLLQASVFRLVSLRRGVVWQGIQWLGRIQEYGLVMQMTDRQRRWFFAQMKNLGLSNKGGGASKGGRIVIPPRPIWRTAFQDGTNRMQIYKVVHDAIRKHLTN